MQLRDFDFDGFLRESWQKKPHLIRNPWKSWTNPLEPDALAETRERLRAELALMARWLGLDTVKEKRP